MVKKQHIYVGLLVILMIVLTVFAWQMTIQAWPSNEELTFLKAFLYYQSYIMPFFLALVISWDQAFDEGSDQSLERVHKIVNEL